MQQPTSESVALEVESPSLEETKGGSTISILARNSASNIVRVGVTALVAILLPGYLTRHLDVHRYAAWILILQLGAYVAYLNLGVQTALAKFIAEYEARADLKGCERCASVGFAIMIAAGVLGMGLSLLLAWGVPRLFREMPRELLHDVRVSVVLVGFSLSVGLVTSVFSAIFLGLQRYGVPMAIAIASRMGYALVIATAVFLHSSLVTMAMGAAAVNLLTCVAEVVCWKLLAARIAIRLSSLTWPMTREMLAYCSILTVWSACTLFISGLDVTIVGHYDFSQVAFYSIANAPTNMILMLIGAVMGPLLPAASALSVSRDARQMGQMLLRSTRLFMVGLMVTGIPILVGGFALLRAWVGPVYAAQSVVYLHLLVLANVVRNVAAPYSTMVIATARQRAGTASPITEAIVNLTCSLLLVKRMGAPGVAVGTLIGAVAGVAMHFAITMHYTQNNFNIARASLFLKAIVRPAVAALPTLLLVRFWFVNHAPSLVAWQWTAWALATSLLLWGVSFTKQDRAWVRQIVAQRLLRA